MNECGFCGAEIAKGAWACPCCGAEPDSKTNQQIDSFVLALKDSARLPRTNEMALAFARESLYAIIVYAKTYQQAEKLAIAGMWASHVEGGK